MNQEKRIAEEPAAVVVGHVIGGSFAINILENHLQFMRNCFSKTMLSTDETLIKFQKDLNEAIKILSS